MTTSIVILNWNGRDFLRKYLPCLLKSVEGSKGVKVVVIDNGSEDDSLEVLSREFPKVKTVPLDRNYGFAGGYNRGLKGLRADLFLLLNSDVEVPEGFLDHLVEWMEYHPECGICAPLLHCTFRKDAFEYAGAAGGYLDRYFYPFCRGRVMNRLELDHGQYDTPQEVLWASGAALLVRSSVFRTIGGFCDDFFAHMEEIDLCLRTRINGWKVHIVPRSVVYHEGGGTLAQGSPFKLYLNYRNNLLMMQRCLAPVFALQSAFNLMAKSIHPDEGPDMAHNCTVMYCDEYDDLMQDDVLHGCTDIGIWKMKYTIFMRMVLDGLSALVYLLKFRPAYFLAVVRAHIDFRRMRVPADHKSITKWMEPVLRGERNEIISALLTTDENASNLGRGTFHLKGIWSKSIVIESILKKDAIFAEIKDNIR